MEHLIALLTHARWADLLMLDALARLSPPPPPVLREMNHVVGASEVWLSRLEGRTSRVPVWPELPLAEVQALAIPVHDGLAAYLARAGDEGLGTLVAYRNSAGRSFETAARDILLQLTLHGQYHRGKINQLLRDAGLDPVPVDYISFVRGVPAATTAPRT